MTKTIYRNHRYSLARHVFSTNSPTPQHIRASEYMRTVNTPTGKSRWQAFAWVKENITRSTTSGVVHCHDTHLRGICSDCGPPGVGFVGATCGACNKGMYM
jgi:hypothetical protein